jgi:hypothetical protein
MSTRKAKTLSPSRRREAPCEGTNTPQLFTPGETKALAESKVHQISRAWVTNDGWSSSLKAKVICKREFEIILLQTQSLSIKPF